MVNLSPGEYRYRIVFYNLLRKPEITLDWQSFTVRKAEIPRISTHAPDGWFLEDGPPLVTVEGSELMTGAAVSLVKNDAPDKGHAGTELERKGTSSVLMEFPSDTLTTGVYDIVFTNPGGLSSAAAGAIRLRHKLPAPSGLLPEEGIVFGPAELKGMRAIRFSWDAVPEATHYTFRLFRGAEPEPMIGKDFLPACEWTLDDLSLLDRGEFRWTVEAVAWGGDRVTIPPAGAAEAVFSINLPQILAPALKPGDVFYGR